MTPASVGLAPTRRRCGQMSLRGTDPATQTVKESSSKRTVPFVAKRAESADPPHHHGHCLAEGGPFDVPPPKRVYDDPVVDPCKAE